jgi:hypothetical protein
LAKPREKMNLVALLKGLAMNIQVKLARKMFLESPAPTRKIKALQVKKYLMK